MPTPTPTLNAGRATPLAAGRRGTASDRARLLRPLAALLCLGLSACINVRPMQPPPPLYALWAKPGVDQQGVRGALLDCGFPSASHVDGATITNNDYARGEQCMLGKGFAYQERHTYCDTHPHLAACPAIDGAAAAESRQRPPAYEQWTRPDADAQRVQQAMRACGYASVIEPGDDMLLNDIAAAQLCMLDQGFRLTLPANALLCRNPPMLAACRGRVIDTAHCCAPPRAAGQR
ncbi:hypothetical protein [Achromobacter insuavis]|uniref:hypothetical protein n=1 Tax=Achromobacter insuavis TaxID=1287735 RepID=UPI0029D7C7A0|nr:hypothetical protein [Achromobacter sp.]MCG2601835.1 hypothetical protein [Achromobacter sp.]